MNNTSLKNLINQCSKDVTVTFCGAPVNVPANKYLYSKVFAKYDALAKQAHGKLFNKANQLNKWTDLEKLYDSFAECAKPLVNEISKDAISVDCYYLDKNTIMKFCESQGYFVELNNIAQTISDQYSAITEQYNMDVANREALKENRAQFHTVTVSNRFRDAIKNEVKTGLANAATGLLCDIFNAKANQKSREKAFEQLDTIYNLHKTSFIAAAAIAYNRFYLMLIAMLNDDNNKFGNEDFQVSDFEVNSARTIHNNLKELNLPTDKQYDLARQIIKIIPYEQTYYSDFYRRFPKYRTEIFNTAAFFGVDISLTVYLEASQYLNAHLNNVIDKDCNEIKNDLQYFEEIASECSLSGNYSQDLFNIIDKNFIESTRKEIKRQVVCAPATYEAIQKCRNYLNDTITEYDTALDSLREKNINIDISSKEYGYQELYNIIDERNRELLCQEVKNILSSAPESLIKAEEHITLTAKQQDFSDIICSPAKELISTHRNMLADDFINSNIGSTEEEAEQCLEKFNGYADLLKLDSNYRNNCVNKIKNKLADFELEYRTISGIVLESKEKADEMRNIIAKYPQIFDNGYSYNSRDEILNAMKALKELALPEKFDTVYSDALKKRLKAYDKACTDNLINNPPEMISHSDYEDYIAKLQELTEDDRAIDQAYLYEIKLRQFESDCSKADSYEKKASEKNWWFDTGTFIAFFLFFAAIAAIIIALISWVYHDDMTLFTKPVTYLISIPIQIIASIYSLYDTGVQNKEMWHKLTSNGKIKLQDISRKKNPDRKKTEMPRFEKGETSFTQIGQVVKLPDNSKTVNIYNSTKRNSATVVQIKKDEYVGIIPSDQKSMFYHVKYYNKNGIYYGYVYKNYLKVQNIEKNIQINQK